MYVYTVSDKKLLRNVLKILENYYEKHDIFVTV